MRSVPAWPFQPWISLSLALMLAMPAIPASALEARPPILIHSGDTTQLELASGERLTAPLPAGAEVASAGALGEHGWVVAAIRGQEIVVMTGEAGQAKTLPAPPVAGRLRREPLPLVEDGRLAGLVWLDGNAERALAVRYARYNGTAWEKPQTVSAPGPGSQLALTVARLGDGAWLLAWSAFDGHDDEIVWSRQDGNGRWSAPRRVTADNAVPDITPALTATADGALLAWSRFDGDGYRVVISRFRAGKWDAPRLAGPSGSLFPSFEASGTGTLLLYQNAVPAGWSAVEVDGTGSAGRRATLSSSRRARPVVEAAADRSGVTFRWPAAAEERAADWERP